MREVVVLHGVAVRGCWFGGCAFLTFSPSLVLSCFLFTSLLAETTTTVAVMA